MQFTPNANRLLLAPQEDSRLIDLRIWMLRHGVTYSYLGNAMGITGNGVMKLLRGERMPVARHRELLELGLPFHLLPMPLDVPAGPKSRASAEANQATEQTRTA
jgi:transcriptional regulator with XRE-family HTH domain